MRPLTLTALLCAALASAQLTPPATPPSRALPATPAAAPALPPAGTVPAGGAVVTLTAPVGSAVELVTTSTSRLTASDLTVTALPGSTVTAAQLNEARRTMTQAVEALNRAGDTTVTGKAFYKVTGRDAAGNTTVTLSAVQTLPARPGKAPMTSTLRVTQVIGVDGKVSGLKLESDDAQTNRVLQALNSGQLQKMAEQSGAAFGGVYGQPLVVGVPQTRTVSMDMQGFYQSILSLTAGPQGAQLFRDVQATPLNLSVSTTYRGRNGRGDHVLESTSTGANWKMSVANKELTPPVDVNFTLLDMLTTTTSTYASSGLPTGVSTQNKMKMNVVLALGGVQVSMNMSMVQTQTMRPR